jgi:hypothetical protein
METSQFESVKVALKQDNSGYVLTLRIHPDEISEEILRDFVGARYMTVLVRLTEEERPMNREAELGRDMVRVAGMLCRDPMFWDFLDESSAIFEKSEAEATDWMQTYLKVESRSEIAKSKQAIDKLIGMKTEFNTWKQAKN